MVISSEQVAMTVGWWAGSIRCPEGTSFSSMQIEEFCKTLREYICNAIDRGEEKIVIDCDYEPKGILLSAEKWAGLPDGCFPKKTLTILRADGSLELKCGYGAEFIKLIKPRT